MAAGAACDAVWLEPFAQALGGYVGAGVATGEQPSLVAGDRQAPLAQGERDRAERLRQHDRAARERDRGLALAGGSDVGRLERGGARQRLGVEEQQTARQRSRGCQAPARRPQEERDIDELLSLGMLSRPTVERADVCHLMLQDGFIELSRRVLAAVLAATDQLVLDRKNRVLSRLA